MSAEEIKRELTRRSADLACHLFPQGKRIGNHWCVGSIAGEPGRSFRICIAGDKVGLWGDFDGGQKHQHSLVDLWMEKRGVDFKTAARECAAWLGMPLDFHSNASLPSRVPRLLSNGLPVPMSDSDCNRALAMAATLKDDFSLCERIARARNWDVQTIIDLASEPSLGWDSGKLAFVYESGVKLRSRQEGERIIRWAFGKPWIWRGSFLWGRSTIYICEGETDCISLVDTGFENDGQTLAVAIPSASTFAEDWAQLFKGKNVILALDGDRAGEEATHRISLLLRPVVSRLGCLNWGGLQRAS